MTLKPLSAVDGRPLVVVGRQGEIDLAVRFLSIESSIPTVVGAKPQAP